jgi:hypothetical protein
VEAMVLGLFARTNLFSVPSGDFAAEARGTASVGLFARTNFFPFLRVILPGSRRGAFAKGGVVFHIAFCTGGEVLQ